MKTPRNLRAGSYYLLGSLALILAAWGFRPWGAVLLWPACSFLVIAAGYAGAGPAIYGKRDGVLSLPVRLFMGPVLLGQHLSLHHYARQCRAWDRVAPGLVMGKRLNEAEARALLAEGITAVLDLTSEFSEVALLRNLHYLNVPILDLTAPTTEQLRTGVEFIGKHAQGGIVYVHCKTGYSRAAAFVGAHLIATGVAGKAGQAMARMRSVRPSIVIRPEIVSVLDAVEGTLRSAGWSGPGEEPPSDAVPCARPGK